MHDDDVDVIELADEVVDLAHLIALSIHTDGTCPLEFLTELASDAVTLAAWVPRPV